MNRVIIACAGSGKTSGLVKKALRDPTRRIAFLTYTNNNILEIRKKFGEMASGVPKGVDLLTWYTFLLRECARPYQRAKHSGGRIESLLFVNRKSAPFARESDTARYYFARNDRLYSDKLSQFVIECDSRSSGAVIRRLADIFTDIFIDEFQDLAGWDLDLVGLLLRSKLRVTLVGDPRQHIYRTSPSPKNAQFLGTKILALFESWVESDLCELETITKSYRCNREICAWSNLLWPELKPMTSRCGEDNLSEGDGVFLVSKSQLAAYVDTFRPQILRHDKRSNTHGYNALNFGQSKGLQFPRVLIIPTGPIKKFLRTGDLRHVEKSRQKLHVAVTRASQSVAFLSDDSSPIISNRWEK